MATIATVLFFDDIQAEKKQFVMPLVGGQIDINTSVMTYQHEKTYVTDVLEMTKEK